ncbi:MAG TPA: PAS domain S-box protein [Phycisphaerae bacterium]|nr:PAS domain S-box protein [Phycisphaerae bacterium]
MHEIGNTSGTGSSADVPSLVILVGPDGRIAGCSGGAQGFFGQGGSELVGRSVISLLEGVAAEFASEAIALHREESTGIHDRRANLTIRRADGTMLRVMACASAISIKPPLLAFTFDLESPEMRQAALLRRLIDALPDYLFIKDTESRVVINNVAHARNLGLPPEACVGKTDRDFFPPCLAEKYLADEARVVRQGTIFQDEEATIDRKGNHRWKLTTKIPLQGPEGGIIGLAGINHDITEMKQAQRALAESEERHRILYHNTPVMLHSFDMNNIVVHVSDYWLNCMGYSREEVEGQSVLQFFSEAARQYMRDVVMPEFHGVGRISNVPLEYITRNGQAIAVEVSAVAQCDETGKIVSGLAVSIDVTQRRKAEAEREELHRRLLELSRHAGMAEVATGVLHNVGNVLNSVNVAAGLITDKIRNSPVKKLIRAVELMKRHAEDLGAYVTSDPRGKQLPGYFNAVASVLKSDEESILTELGVLLKHVDHIKEIVRVQQSFAQSRRILEALNLAGVIEDAVRISTATSGAMAEKIDLNCPPSLAVISDRHALLQILTNLIANACQSVRAAKNPDKRINIRAAKVTRGDSEFFTIHVADNGVGIDPQNLNRIFSHGFTTKANGHGFGLHSAANTAKRLGGSLEASSPGLDQGAVFVLTLPACKEVVAP